MKEAKQLAGTRLGRIGYQGASEGGWVVPLAANRAYVDFAIVSPGLAVTRHCSELQFPHTVPL